MLFLLVFVDDLILITDYIRALRTLDYQTFHLERLVLLPRVNLKGYSLEPIVSILRAVWKRDLWQRKKKSRL